MLRPRTVSRSSGTEPLNRFFQSFSVAALGALCQIASVSAAPNIVVLIADDMGWGDVGYHDSDIGTPEIDRLAAEGIELDRFYVQSVCSPTRATLMTGRSPLSHGVSSPFNPWYANGLAFDEKLMPEYLREGGYQTHAVGKWHLGPNEPGYHPLNRGFDTYYGNLHGYMDYETHAVFGRIDWQRDGATVIEEGYSTHLLADEAVRHIKERDPDRPVFLYVAFSAPHSPLQAPAATIAEYADIEDENRRIYAAMVTEMDRAIARITTALDEEQMMDDTLLMFFTDNGGRAKSRREKCAAARQQGFALGGWNPCSRIVLWIGGARGRSCIRPTDYGHGSPADVSRGRRDTVAISQAD